MEKTSLLKKLVILVLVLGCILSLSGVVFADDDLDDLDSDWSSLDDNTSSNTNTENNTTNNTTNTNVTTNNTSVKSTVNSVSNNTATNRSVSNTNSLAKTGIADTTGIVAIIVIASGIVALYSYKKVNDYKNL